MPSEGGSLYELPDHVTAVDVRDELMLLDQRSREVVKLNETACYCLRSILGGRDMQGIVLGVADFTGCAIDVAWRDCAKLNGGLSIEMGKIEA